MVRTSAVCLLAASVFENSRAVQEVLYCVCSEDYNEEVSEAGGAVKAVSVASPVGCLPKSLSCCGQVHRFLVQVTTEDVALTGLNMFKVTRGLLLTVAGTILTYEVVLVQLK